MKRVVSRFDSDNEELLSSTSEIKDCLRTGTKNFREILSILEAHELQLSEERSSIHRFVGEAEKVNATLKYEAASILSEFSTLR